MSADPDKRALLAARLKEAGVEPTARAVAALVACNDAEAALAKMAAGVPFFRALGSREFHGLDLALGPDTLEPRDDTEALIDATLEALGERRTEPLRLADLGTGTGAVALALLMECPRAQVVATDISAAALEVAEANAQAAGLALRFAICAGSWVEPLEGTFDAIISNPPYIASAVVDSLDASVRDHDPRRALDGGTDGLDAYRAIFAGAAVYLKPSGFLALEIGYDQRDSVTALGQQNGWRCTGQHVDLGGRDRALVFTPEQDSAL